MSCRVVLALERGRLVCLVDVSGASRLLFNMTQLMANAPSLQCRCCLWFLWPSLQYANERMSD